MLHRRLVRLLNLPDPERKSRRMIGYILDAYRKWRDDMAAEVSEGVRIVQGPHEFHAPHCDELVLHAPGRCRYCDMFEARQMQRVEKGINFTGENFPHKLPCPSTRRRTIEAIEQWPGNRAKP